MSQFQLILDSFAAMHESDTREEGDAVAELLQITEPESHLLVASICESADSDPLHHPAAIGFILGLKLGERVGYGRGARLMVA